MAILHLMFVFSVNKVAQVTEQRLIWLSIINMVTHWQIIMGGNRALILSELKQL